MPRSRALHYDPASYFIYAVETPAIDQIIEASTARPYLAIGYTINVEAVAALLVEHEPTIRGDGFTTYPVNDDLLDARRRMMRLLDRPVEIPVLAAMLEREIIFRLLQGPQGEKLRLLARADSRLCQIRRAIGWIRTHYHQPIQVGHLAELAHMSNAAFHRHFKAATAMSPIQYQKQIRLLEARNLLVAKPGSAARVAFAVGYESGDLRGTLAALDEAAHGLLGYGKRPDASLSLADVQPFLRRRYEADVRARLTQSQADELERLVRKVGLEPFIVKDAVAAWQKERSRAARILAELQKAGYIAPIERATSEERGRPATVYSTSGAALLAFGSE